jgi:hypothetical protein
VEIQNLEEKLRKTERYIQSREVEIEQRLRVIDERGQAINLREDELRQKLASFRAQEEKLRLRETALQQMEVEKPRNGEDKDDDLVSVVSRISNNSPRRNYDPYFKDGYRLKDSENYGNQG